MKLRFFGFAVLFFNSIHAAGDMTGAITLSGTVPEVTAIVVTGMNKYNQLDFSTSANDLLIARVREINNTANGYTVTAMSQNGGKFKNASSDAEISYSVKYD